MSSGPELETELDVLERKWDEFTRLPATPRTLMSVIEYSLGPQRKGEEYVNRLLRYLLDPEEPHGIDAEFLSAFVEGLPEECSFDEDTYDLGDVDVSEQVRVGSADSPETASQPDLGGIADLVVEVPNEWYLLAELKFRAGENNLRGDGFSQTEQYCWADQIHGVPKDDYDSGAYYLYLHHRDEPPASEEQFTNWTWEAFTRDVLEPFVAQNTPRYPQRTANQLRALVDDVRNIVDMTENERPDEDKVALYLEHYEAIADVSDTFDERWESFTDEWGRLLSEDLERRGHGSVTERTDDVVAFEVQRDGGPPGDWRFRFSSSDWGMLFRDGWWCHTDDLAHLDSRPDDRNDVRIGFHHRLDRNRDAAIRDEELYVHFRNMGANDQEFIDAFDAAFDARHGEIETALPDRAVTTGNKRDMVRAEYDIHTDGSSDFFETYVSALARAFEDFVVDNPELVELLTETYDEATERYR